MKIMFLLGLGYNINKNGNFGILQFFFNMRYNRISISTQEFCGSKAFLLDFT